jgi:hypothetical protein
MLRLIFELRLQFRRILSIIIEFWLRHFFYNAYVPRCSGENIWTLGLGLIPGISEMGASWNLSMQTPFLMVLSTRIPVLRKFRCRNLNKIPSGESQVQDPIPAQKFRTYTIYIVLSSYSNIHLFGCRNGEKIGNRRTDGKTNEGTISIEHIFLKLTLKSMKAWKITRRWNNRVQNLSASLLLHLKIFREKNSNLLQLQNRQFCTKIKWAYGKYWRKFTKRTFFHELM